MESILNYIYKTYTFLFGNIYFSKINKLLFNLSIRGLGVLIFDKDMVSKGEIKFLKKFLKNKPQPVIIDVGANIGNYSKRLFEINKNAQVLAFEPHPKTFQKLVLNINSKNFKAFNFGLSDKAEKIFLFDYESNDGSAHASIHKEVFESIYKQPLVQHSIKVETLDEIFFSQKHFKQIDLLKIDTEGSELKVLKGSKRLLKEKLIKTIHFEFNEMNIISKVTFKEFRDMLIDFDFYRILSNGDLLPLKSYWPVMNELYAFQNIIAIQKKNV